MVGNNADLWEGTALCPQQGAVDWKRTNIERGKGNNVLVDACLALNSLTYPYRWRTNHASAHVQITSMDGKEDFGEWLIPTSTNANVIANQEGMVKEQNTAGILINVNPWHYLKRDVTGIYLGATGRSAAVIAVKPGSARAHCKP